MPDNIYEVLAQGARYWFLFWMALIVWRSWRWYRKDRRAAKKRLKLLPDAGFVGEMVVVEGGGVLERGAALAVPREGTLGALRTNDLFIPADGIDSRHLWFRFDDRKGLMVQPFGKCAVLVDDRPFESRHQPLYMAHGSWLTVGSVQMRLRLFAGFESVGHAQRRAGVELPDKEPAQEETQGMTQEAYQAALYQQWQMQEYARQQAYQQGYQQAMAQMEAPADEEPITEPYEEPAEAEPEWPAPKGDALPYDMAQLAREQGLVDNSIFMRPQGQKKAEMPVENPPMEETVFYPPVTDDEADPDPDDWVLEPDEDMTDAAAPPRSAYIGRDEAERAKREVWDKYFGGGARS